MESRSATRGLYEKLVGRVYFAVDPGNPHNQIIADIDKAPRNAEGKVEFSSDLYIIKPKDSAKGNGVVFFDIVNRGNKQLLRSFSRGGGSADPSTEADFGDAYLLQQGYTLVAVGWQFDVAKGRGLVAADVPIATDNGKAITGWVKMWFISNEPVMSVRVRDRLQHVRVSAARSERPAVSAHGARRNFRAAAAHSAR